MEGGFSYHDQKMQIEDGCQKKTIRVEKAYRGHVWLVGAILGNADLKEVIDYLPVLKNTQIYKLNDILKHAVCILSVYVTGTFSVFLALKEAIEMLDSVKGSYWSDKERFLEGLEDLEGELVKPTASNLLVAFTFHLQN